MAEPAAPAPAAPAPAAAPPARSILSEAFAQRLFPYQKEGIEFAVAAGGRCLIADEMGLGKTAQAIGVLGHYAAELPALVVVPASVKFSWASELEKWSTLPASRIKLVRSRNDCDALRDADITILTYGMLSEKAAIVEAIQRARFRIVVLDESHSIKNSKSQRCQLLAPILRSVQRLIMLSGTPALARPVELYTQVSAIAPSVFGSFPAYTKRYCNAHQGRFGWDVSGASNLGELHEKLKSIMVRRLKKAVLTQLPDKIRQRVTVEVPADKLKAMKATIAQLDELKKKLFSGEAEEGLGDPDASGRFEQGRLLHEAYRMTGEAKINGAIAYLQDALEGSSEQVLVFAHHQAVLDALEQALNRGKIKFIRIDGSTPTAERHRLVTTFQKDAKYRCALLSLTAAGQGITLTAATRVIFVELHWTPGVLLQAEDRAHRIGQKSHVSVVYLMAEGYTIDSIVWGILARKTNLLGKALDGKTNKLEAEMVKASGKGGGAGVTGEEELSMFFAAEQDGRASGGGGGGRGGTSGHWGNLPGSFPKGDVRSFFNRPTASAEAAEASARQSTIPSPVVTAAASKQKKKPARKQQPKEEDDDEAVVLIVDDDETQDEGGNDSEVELVLPPPSSSSSSTKTATTTTKSTPSPAPPPPLGPWQQQQQQPSSSASASSATDVVVWACGTCTFNNSRPRPAPTNKAPVACEMCATPAPPALQPPRSLGGKSKAAASSALAPPKKLAKLQAGQKGFSSSEAVVKDEKLTAAEAALWERLTFSVSANTGRISLECASGGGIKQDPSVPAPRCNFSIEEHKELLATKGTDTASLVNTPFEALAAALHAGLAGGNDGGPGRESLCQALLAEVGRFIDQWTALRGWERKALADGRALRLPLAAQVQAAEEKRKAKQQGPCFDRYLPPPAGAASTGGGGGGSDQAPAGSAIPAYVPGKPKAPAQPAAAAAVSRPSKSPAGVSYGSQQSSSSSQPLECAWCHAQITDAQTLSAIALQQGVAGGRRGHVFCKYECGQELLLRAGSSSLIRRQLFAMEHGVCQICGLDAYSLFEKLKSLTPPERIQELMKLDILKHFPDTAIQNPQEFHCWQADHELPVAEGGGQCGLHNLRTLCVPCHSTETKALRQRLKQAKVKRAAAGTKDLRECFSAGGGKGPSH